VGQPLHGVIHHSRADGSPYPVEECPMHQALIDGTKHTAEDVYWRKDGTPFPVSCTSMPILHDGR
jgi:hypothetical protein